MSQPLADRLCVFAAPQADAAHGATAQQLKQSGLTLWVWPPLQPQAPAPAAYDALVVLGGGEWPAAVQPALVALLRQAWLRGATIGLFDGAASLIGAAEIGPGGAPLEAAGLFTDRAAPGPGTLQELIDAVQCGPYRDR